MTSRSSVDRPDAAAAGGRCNDEGRPSPAFVVVAAGCQRGSHPACAVDQA
ncbi:hypothetical protein IMZ29_12835 [Achromobacter sp. GG226]|nr:hypothetical protein [Verticiella sp. GG226]MBU4611379.1 hypothetical protein [Verticiella sp. GG226]